MSSPRISEVSIAWASPAQVKDGLLGFVSMLLDGHVKVDGVCLRRTAAGELTLSYPSRQDHAGRHHPIVRPVSDEARRELERQVFEALGLAEDAR